MAVKQEIPLNKPEQPEPEDLNNKQMPNILNFFFLQQF